MNYKHLEQYQETGRRIPLDLNAPRQQETKEEQKIRLSKIDKNREIKFISKDIKKGMFWSNIHLKYIPNSELTEELEEKEKEFIPYI